MKNAIQSPAQLRALLFGTMEALLKGDINPQVANSISSLSGEVHKSLTTEMSIHEYLDTLPLEKIDVLCLPAGKLPSESGD